MWATFDKEEFPLVKVKLSGGIKEEDFNHFISEWLQLICDKKLFMYLFDTNECEFVNIKYIFKLAAFMKKVKAMPEHYLDKSIIVINNSALRGLLNILFSVQKPISTVYVCRNMIDANNTINAINNNSNIPKSVVVYKK